MSVSNINSTYFNINDIKDGALNSAYSTDIGTDTSIFANGFLNNTQRKVYDYNETDINDVSSLTSKLNKIKEEQGFIGKIWDGIKNLTGLGASSDKTEVIIKQYENGEISFDEAQSALEKYEDGQNMAVDVAGDMISGMVSAGAAMAAPFTGGASLLFAGAVGAAVKVGIKGADSFIGGKEYGIKDIGYDLITGSINGAMAPLTNALGGAAGTGIAKVCGLNVAKSAASEGVEAAGKSFLTRLLAKQGAEYVLKEGAEATIKTTLAKAAAYGVDMAIDGAISGATDGFARSFASGNFEDMDENITQGFFGGLVAAPIIGGGFRLAGKAGSAIGKKLGGTNIDAPELNLKNLELDLDGDGIKLNDCLPSYIKNSAGFRERVNTFNIEISKLQADINSGELSTNEGSRKFFSLLSDLAGNDDLAKIASDTDVDITGLKNSFIQSRSASSLEVLKNADSLEVFKQLLKLDSNTINPFECAAAYAGLDSASKEVYQALLNMTKRGDIDPSVLKGWKNSIIDPKFAKKVLTYNKAISDGLSDLEIKDLFVPRTSSLEDGLSKVSAGDLFECDNRLLIKLQDGTAKELKISRDTYFNLFPVADYFSQGEAGDCYCLAAFSSMLDTPKGKSVLLSCFEETTDGKLSVSLPEGRIKLTTDLKGTLPADKLKYESRYAKGSNGIKLLEAVYGDEITYKRTKPVIESLENMVTGGKMNDAQKQFALDILDSLAQTPDSAPKYVLTEIPKQALNQHGIQTPISIKAGIAGNLRDLALVSYDDLSKITQILGETSEIYYRANTGNPVEIFNMFGLNSLKTPRGEIRGKLMLESIPENILYGDNFLFAASVADKTGTIKGTEAIIDFNKGLFNGHAYSLSIKQGPVENLYILRNPHNSSRQIILNEEEFEKYVKSIGIAKK